MSSSSYPVTTEHPFDGIFGSPALVKLVRVLVHEVAGPVGVTQAASMTGLSRAGARKALERLERAGVAARVGTGRAQKYASRDGSPYTATLRRLFEEEQQHHDELVGRLKAALALPEVREAWIGQPFSASGGVIRIELIADIPAIPWIDRELRTRLAETETLYNLIIETTVFTRADLPTLPPNAVWLVGSGATDVDLTPGVQTHVESTERSLRMARSTAELLKRDTSLIRRARQHISWLLKEGQGTANSDLAEWAQLLDTYSPERVRDFLVSTSSRAERLRRSSPFFAVLTPEERDQVMSDVESRT